ncbi:MAG: TIM44-like domain-containing protein [Clostridia bacterium]
MKAVLKFLALTLAIVFVLLPSTGLADLGGFSGDSSYGGGSSDWGSSSSSDWGSSSNDWDSSSDWNNDSDNNSSSNSNGVYFSGSNTTDNNDTSDDGGGLGFWLILMAVGAIIFFVLKAGKGKNGGVAPGAVPTSQALLKPISELIAQDPEFSEAALCDKLSNLYVQMQNACQNRNLDPMRATFTDALYAQFDRQLDALIQAHQTNRIERISVLGTRIMGYMQDDVNDIIIARLQTRIVDYVVDDITGNVVRGSNTTELFMDYEWTLIRTKGKQTVQQNGATQIHCNACGAPVDINHSAKCEYCGSIVTSSDYDWVISAIKGISQHS